MLFFRLGLVDSRPTRVVAVWSTAHAQDSTRDRLMHRAMEFTIDYKPILFANGCLLISFCREKKRNEM